MNLNELRRKHEELLNGPQQSGSTDFLSKFLKVDMGKNIIRILPWKDESKPFFSETNIHRLPTEDGGVKNYHCRKLENESCPICDFYFELWRMHKEMNLPRGQKSKYGNLATKIKPTPRYYMNVVDRRILEADPNDPASAVKIFSTGQQVYRKILSDVLDPDYQVSDDPDNTTILSLENGNDYVIDLQKKGGYNNYDESKCRIKKTAAGTPHQHAVFMESLHDIHDMIKIGDYEEGRNAVETMRASLFEVHEEGDDGEAEFNQSVRV